MKFSYLLILFKNNFPNHYVSGKNFWGPYPPPPQVEPIKFCGGTCPPPLPPTDRLWIQDEQNFLQKGRNLLRLRATPRGRAPRTGPREPIRPVLVKCLVLRSQRSVRMRSWKSGAKLQNPASGSSEQCSTAGNAGGTPAVARFLRDRLTAPAPYLRLSHAVSDRLSTRIGRALCSLLSLQTHI